MKNTYDRPSLGGPAGSCDQKKGSVETIEGEMHIKTQTNIQGIGLNAEIAHALLFK